MKFILPYRLYEELDYNTYQNASKELRELGFEDRANAISAYGISVKYWNYYENLISGFEDNTIYTVKYRYAGMANYEDINVYIHIIKTATVFELDIYPSTFDDFYKFVYDFIKYDNIKYDNILEHLRHKIYVFIKDEIDFINIIKYESPQSFYEHKRDIIFDNANIEKLLKALSEKDENIMKYKKNFISQLKKIIQTDNHY